MPIVVSNLTKIYGSQKAIDNISFDAGNNEIVGFLGPNGAGKSTTMKIVTGYLQSDSGNVMVNGIEEVIDITGLRNESNKKTGQLSKGYKQRVGLAAALIHNPDVLILDEPT